MTRWKKLGMALGAVLWMGMQTALAQSVVVDGYGTSREAALRDASRNAVEQVVGTLVDSRTIVENMSVKFDEIYSKSQGFVSDVKILSQANESGSVHIKAQMEVNTNPNTQLMNNLSMLMMLNDPRVAVIVLRQTKTGGVQGHDLLAENALNERLLDLGFTHVVDANIVSSLQNAQLLNSIYNGSTGISQIGSSLGADFLVIGRTKTQSQGISLPDGKGGYAPTLLKSGNATLAVKIIKFSTGEILGTFAISGKGVENSNEMAEQRAIEKASQGAANKLEEKFRRISSQVDSTFRVSPFQ